MGKRVIGEGLGRRCGEEGDRGGALKVWGRG